MLWGIAGRLAPELEDVRWIGSDGEERAQLTLSDLGGGPKILYFFQESCEGCHQHGFPNLVRLVDAFGDKAVGFAAIQTVFEDPEVNTFERVRQNQKRYGLHIPYGHAVADGESLVPAVMESYRSAGTPWFVAVLPDGRVLFDGFELDVGAAVRALGPVMA
jgi:hypothetical protein